MDQVTFARVRQRLEDNKRFAARNTKVPSLLQGLAACSACGYACYRGHTTTSAGNKIFYYRCIGSDNYRFEHGKVCDSKPVRADYLDTVVWDHVTAMLADPALIRAEITKRLEQARTADPATRQRSQLELALAKAATGITAMIEAYSEQLITIDELRTRMPHLRARQTSLRGQLDALDAQAADRDAYLTLAGDLEGFLAQLRGNAATATVEDRQRVLRLLVKDILIGPEKITIRHRIPARPGSSGTRQRDPEPDTEGDHRPGSHLRWGRDHPALGGPGDRPLEPCPSSITPACSHSRSSLSTRRSDTRFPDQRQQPVLVDLAEEVPDIGLEDELLSLDERVPGAPPSPRWPTASAGTRTSTAGSPPRKWAPARSWPPAGPPGPAPSGYPAASCGRRAWDLHPAHWRAGRYMPARRSRPSSPSIRLNPVVLLHVARVTRSTPAAPRFASTRSHASHRTSLL